MFIKKKLTGFARLIIKKITAHIMGRIGVGLIIAAPFLIVYLVLKWLAKYADNLFGPIRDTTPFVNDVPGIGLPMLAIILYLLGLIVLLATGKKIVESFQKITLKIPLVRNIFKPAKDFAELFSQDTKGIVVGTYLLGGYGLGIYSSDTIAGDIHGNKEPSINFYYPTSPTPNSGFVLIVPKKKIDEIFIYNKSGVIVPMPIDILMAHCISCGTSSFPEYIRKPLVEPN